MDWKISHIAETGSTNADMAALAARDGVGEGFVVWADSQTAGRGRQGRTWFSRPGDGLCFSMLLKPNAKPEMAATLPLVAGVAVASALEQFLPSAEIAVKWPNDILCGGRKICGILCEMAAQGDSVRHVIAGIGINVNLPANELPAEIAKTATSMRILSGKEFSPGEILNAVLASFARCYARWQEAGLAAVKGELDARDALRGRRVEMRLLRKPFSGTAVGIAESGALLLRLDDGATEEVFSGEAHIVR